MLSLLTCTVRASNRKNTKRNCEKMTDSKVTLALGRGSSKANALGRAKLAESYRKSGLTKKQFLQDVCSGKFGFDFVDGRGGG